VRCVSFEAEREVRYDSDIFSAPYSWGHLPLGRTMLPRHEWPPRWGDALDTLRAEIMADGVDGHRAR
jgi:hypothetical protein